MKSLSILMNRFSENCKSLHFSFFFLQNGLFWTILIKNDFLQLPTVRGKLKFSRFSDKYSMKHLSGLKLWLLFKHEELTKIITENGKLFTDLIKFHLVILMLT